MEHLHKGEFLLLKDFGHMVAKEEIDLLRKDFKDIWFLAIKENIYLDI